MTRKEFARRRKRLLSSMERNSIAILPAAASTVRNRDVEHPYRPDSDFYYLTGFAEPEAVAVLISGRRQGEFILFCRDRDPKLEVWNGPRAGPEGACGLFGADDAYPIDVIDEILPGLIENRARVYYTMGLHAEYDQKITEWLNQIRRKSRSGIHAPDEIVALEHLVHEMRLFKSAEEIKIMRKAAAIAAGAHLRAMRHSRAGIMEYQLEAEIVHEFMSHGCPSPAYPSIVGSGENACVLHYTANSAPLRDGDLVLIDAGAEFEYYASDITRTFPVNGRFSKEQRQVYEVVLAAQKAAIEKVRPGNHWDDPHRAAVRALTRGLIKLGLLKGKLNELIRDKAYERFFMHRTGHWLGMDVHDVGDYKVGDTWRLLEPGMVLTVEPGLYIAPGSKGVAKRWWGIGIRIEDDVLVTKAGHEVLSHAAPKSVTEIESLMAGPGGRGSR